LSSINRLPKTSSLTGADLLALFSSSLGSDAATTLTTLLTWLQSQLSASGGFTTQYAAPSATGFSVTIAPPATGGSVYLLLTPVAGYAAGTVLMPASAVDEQEVLCACTQVVTTLTVSGNGNTINGAPTTLAAGGFFRMRFDGVLKTWNRCG
jgi:hypothetical protein